MDDKGQTEPETGSGHYYEVVDLALLRKPQAILAHEMNGKPLEPAHGAPHRLRLETQLGFKMVEFMHAIELVKDYRDVGGGMGGWREDTQQ
jgi:DMSO/TMAO reductase YedYZ molybdopterin-dependent catalytic subunit